MKNTIKKLLESSTTIALFWHKNPDGDSIGGMLGLGKLLEKMGKKVFYFTPTLPSKMYNFLPDIKKISSSFDYGTYDILVYLDFSETNRIAPFYDVNPAYFDQKTTIVIDHHVYKETNKKRNIISDSSAMSSCELIFEHSYARWPQFYDQQIATYLYLWLATDSGNFRYDEDHKRILHNALSLVNLWADKKLIINNMFRKKSFAGLKMMQILFRRLKEKVRTSIYSIYRKRSHKITSGSWRSGFLTDDYPRYRWRRCLSCL
jgi:bifunctional oligoribonuclease and PAP phosphatase NrnA